MIRALKSAVSVLSVAVLLVGVAPVVSLACKSAGAFKHVGVVTAVDAKALTLTIKDAETGEPITFSATAKQLEDLNLGDQVMVGFIEQDGALKAVQIHT